MDEIVAESGFRNNCCKCRCRHTSAARSLGGRPAAAGIRLEPASASGLCAMWIASAVSYTGFEIRNYAAPLLDGRFHQDFIRELSKGMILYTFTASTLPIPLLVLFAGRWPTASIAENC